MTVPVRIQRAAQKLNQSVNFDELESHLNMALQIDKMMVLIRQEKYERAYDIMLSVIDSKKGGFSRYATEVGELLIQDMIPLLFQRNRREDAFQVMKQWLRRFPGHPGVSCRLVENMSRLDEARAKVKPSQILAKAIREHPYALQPRLLLAGRVAFVTMWSKEFSLIKLVTPIWGDLRLMEWVVPPTRYNILYYLANLFGATYRALVTPQSQSRLREMVAQVEELLKPDEKPLLTEEQFNFMDTLNAAIQQDATPQEEQELLEKIDIQTIRELLEGAEVYEQVEKWLDKGRLHHAYRRLITFEQLAQHPLRANFLSQADLVLSVLTSQEPSRGTRLDDLLDYADAWAALQPGAPRPHLRRAMLLMQKGSVSEATSAIETVMRLSPKGIEPPIFVAVVTGFKRKDAPVQLKVIQSLQRAWQNLPGAQWIMPPSYNHVQDFLRVLVILTAIGIGVFAGMREEAMEILNKSFQRFGRTPPSREEAF